MSKEADPVVHYRGTDGNWYKQNGDTMTNTGRSHEGLQGNNYERFNHTTGYINHPNNRRGGVVNQDVMLVLAEIQRNKNAFAILAENKRVDIDIVAVVDNIVKNSYKYFTQSLAKYLYYII